MTKMFYRVVTEDGQTTDVPVKVWEDVCMCFRDTYTKDNCEWWDDILDGLRDHVPGQSEFVSVEVIRKEV